MSDLKPCPFCEAALVWSDTYSEYHHPIAKCILSGHKFKKGMIGQWNRRALPAVQPDDDKLVRHMTKLIAAGLDRIEQLTAERDRLRAALIEERTETLWNAYGAGMERDGRWRHMCMSDGEWLEFECGLDNSQPDHPADVVKAAIPFAAERFVAALTGKEPSHE